MYTCIVIKYYVHLYSIFIRTIFLLQTLNCKPIASLDHFGADMLASADMVEEAQCGASKVIKVSNRLWLPILSAFIILVLQLNVVKL